MKKIITVIDGKIFLVIRSTRKERGLTDVGADASPTTEGPHIWGHPSLIRLPGSSGLLAFKGQYHALRGSGRQCAVNVVSQICKPGCLLMREDEQGATQEDTCPWSGIW